jgi:hypothetical protein
MYNNSQSVIGGTIGSNHQIQRARSKPTAYMLQKRYSDSVRMHTPAIVTHETPSTSDSQDAMALARKPRTESPDQNQTEKKTILILNLYIDGKRKKKRFSMGGRSPLTPLFPERHSDVAQIHHQLAVLQIAIHSSALKKTIHYLT